MPSASTAQRTTTPPHRMKPAAPAAACVEPLARRDEQEVLAFLAERPLHTVIMASMLRDNGAQSQLNRGTFYTCRDEAGQLEGVALIGHAIFLEARTDRALAAFASLARERADTHMILGEQEMIQEFWRGYTEAGQELRLACRELMFELRCPVAVRETVKDLRLATVDDLELVLPVQDEMARAESGVSPLEVDPAGFRRRTARRIAQGRTWLVVEDGRLVFKAEVQSETPEVIYLEGIYVDASARRRGLGTRCLSQLCRQLLARVPAICLLVNEQNREAHALYRKVGFRFECLYDTIFLSQRLN
jgi:predicted GNAT family acetyltransferase